MQAVGGSNLGLSLIPRSHSPPQELAMDIVTTTAGLIVALDLGKYKTVACVYDGDPAAARFQTLSTGREELCRLLARHRPAVVVIEACGLAGWVYDLC